MITGLQQFYDDLDALESNFKRDAYKYPEEITRHIVVDIIRKGSIDSGDFITAVDFHSATGSSGSDFTIDASNNSDVVYDDVLERGRQDGRFSGRYHYLTGIEQADYDGVTDEIIQESFVI